MAEYYFSAYQIAEMAVKVEEAGARFYARLADSVKAQEVKNVFMILSKAEVRHQDAFRKIADSFRKEEAGEYSVDLAMLMQNHTDKLKEMVFNLDRAAGASAGVPGAIEVAIQTEKEAIRIFAEIYDNYTEKYHEVLLKIINEEKKHLEILLGVQKETVS
jgi:rubrerythrin